MDSIYASFCETVQLASQDELGLLDEDDGLISRYVQLCEERLASVSVELSEEEVSSWTLERNTWQLVQALYNERLAEPRRADSPSPLGSSSKDAYAPSITVFQRVLDGNKDLLELSAIRDWLHSIPTNLNPAEVRRGYLPYTKNKLKQARRTGAKPPRGLVTELDPDAALREGASGSGNRLDGDDASYERALLRSLFEYVRAGELDLAIDMCRQSDQSWRAASLSGGKLWWDPQLAPGEEGYGEEEGAMDLGESEKRARGTLNRRLWKMMCRKIAASPGLDGYERALYGAISGDSSSVLPVCNSWEDVVWTHVNALFESHVEASLLSSAEGRYWSRGSAHKSVAPAPTADQLDPEDVLLGSAARGVGVREELEQIFDKLLTIDKPELAQQARDPFHVSQTYLIVGRVAELFTTFVDRLEQAVVETEPDTLAHMLRFFAHLILVLRLLKQPLPEYAANRILEAYVQILEAAEQDESLIAFYASKLDGSSAIESYARFLLTFGPETDRASREAALLKTDEHGLDLSKIACRTVELVLGEISHHLPEMSTASAFDAYRQIDSKQLELIRSLEWLTFDKSTYPQALAQANALARYFLSTDKPHAARELLFSLPSDLLPTSAASTEQDDPTLQIREYLDYSALFLCLEKHSRWSEAWSHKPRPTASKIDQANFNQSISNLVDDFYTAALEVLTSDWLKLALDPAASDEDERRLAELVRIRQLLVPHLVLRVHHTLYDTRHAVPANLQRALDLATVVADERFELYREFVNQQANSIGEYLDVVRQASLAALETGTNPFVATAAAAK